MTVDLHLHSTASDGALAPADLVAHAAARGVSQLALTDHDTVAGLDAARSAAEAQGITFVDGIELSTSWRDRTLHIVGLGIQPDDAGLSEVIGRLADERARRATAIGARLARSGLADAAARAQASAGQGQLTRTHFARLLVDDGLARDMGDAFKRYLKPGRPGHVRADWIALADAIAAIEAAGGLSVLAHPFGYGFSHAWRRRAVAAFADAGGRAMEIVTGTTDRAQEQQAARDAIAAGLLGSAGSDFHAPEQFWLAPGRLRALPHAVRPVPWLAAASARSTS